MRGSEPSCAIVATSAEEAAGGDDAAERNDERDISEAGNAYAAEAP